MTIPNDSGINLAYLRSLTEGDPKTLEALIKAFLQDGFQILQAIEEAAQAKDLKLLRINVHNLKGLAASMSIASIEALCIQVEKAIEEDQIEHLNQLSSELLSTFHVVQHQLRLYL